MDNYYLNLLRLALLFILLMTVIVIKSSNFGDNAHLEKIRIDKELKELNQK